MKLSTIEFNGFKRFHGAACNVDGDVVAFVGPNESGKSSILQGLSWLTEDGAPALPAREQNRRHRPGESTLVVGARYRIDDDDIRFLQELDIDPSHEVSRKSVTEFRLYRRSDGGHVSEVDTVIRRNQKPFALAGKSVETVRRLLAAAESVLDQDEFAAADESLARGAALLSEADFEWTAEATQELRMFLSSVESFAGSLTPSALRAGRVMKLSDALDLSTPLIRAAVEAAEKPSPSEAMRATLLQRVPKFVLFADSDRELSESYQLADENVRIAPPAPLRNLLTVASTNVQDLWSAATSGDPASMRTLERRMNETLRTRLQPMWTQSKLTIDLVLNQGGVLEVNIQELDSPEYTVTPIAERSDGLRAFLGLVCFLIAAELEQPPVLLIDEAERNLHYDAQADLVRVLTHELDVHKVIYTTHSPGCLPLDLGTGIRVVARDPNDSALSTLENTFWTTNEPGFSHLLFAMGAGAAAFSAFRRAVLAEGVSEMILLPTLLRNATDGSRLDFQIAFGLSNMAAPRAIGSVALITTFLVDGDQSGNEKRGQLLEAGVPAAHVFQLPKGKAIEDLVERATYMRVLNEFLAEQGKSIPASALAKNVTIAKAVDDYAKSSLGMPKGVSHKIIASRLAALGENLKLSPLGTKFLSVLRPQLEAAFDTSYTLAPSTD